MKRIISIFAAVLILTAALASTALADSDIFYPVSVTRSPDGTEIRKVYELTPQDNPAGIPRSDFEQAGFHYTLLDLLKQLEAYNIGGNNYVKLRDIGAAADFNVYWDGTVQIDTTAPYTGKAPKAALTPEPTQALTAVSADYSAAANPEVFCGPYTREAYNAAYTVLRDHDRTGTVHYSGDTDRQQLENLLAELANGTTLSLRGTGDGAYEIYAHAMDWSIADEATEDFIRESSGLSTDREKVIRVNDWICDHMIYNPKKVVSVNEVASSPSPVEGNCSSFARMMNYLCGRLGIPCIRVHGESHYWNMLYVDGNWSYTDASVNDQVSSRAALLFSNTTRKQIDDPAGLRFLQELLIPAS